MFFFPQWGKENIRRRPADLFVVSCFSLTCFATLVERINNAVIRTNEFQVALNSCDKGLRGNPWVSATTE